MAKLYETVVLIDATLEDAAIEALVKKTQDYIAARGEIVRVDRWGKRRMAYEINGKSHSEYVVYYYRGVSGEAVAELERSLRLDENVLRYLTVVDNPCGLPPEAAAAPTGAEQAHEEALAEERE